MKSLLHRLTVLSTALLVCAWLPAVSSAVPGGGDGGAAIITASFDDDCLAFEAHSTRVIGYVELHYADGQVAKTDQIESHDYSVTGSSEISLARVKSAKTVQTFDCVPVPKPQCSDGTDNDGDLLVDFPSDQGCTDAADDDETDVVTGVTFRTRWRAPDGGTLSRIFNASLGVPANLDVDDDPDVDLVGTISAGSGPTTFVLDVDRAAGEVATLPVAVEAVLGAPAIDPVATPLGRELLAFGYDALDDRAPGGLTLTTVTDPAMDGTAGYTFDLSQQEPGDTLAVTGALFNGSVLAPTSPIRVALHYGDSPAAASAAVAFAGYAGDVDVETELRTGGLDVAASQHLPFFSLTSTGVPLRSGADAVQAEVNGLAGSLSLDLPETGLVARIASTSPAGVPAPIGQLRLAVSPSPTALPAFVSDAQYNANPSNVAFRDTFSVDATGPFTASMRLTGVTSADLDLDPVALTMDHDAARTRPLVISGTLPNSIPGQPATTVSGLINKPSARTVITTLFAQGLPIRLNFENSSPVGSISLGVANLGAVPSAQLALSNVPTRLTGCLDVSSTCRRTDRPPSALPNYATFESNPSQFGTAGGLNRPYPASVSMSFNDLGTSGTSASISSMVTLNAAIQLVAGEAPIEITNARFHSLALDTGIHPTDSTFSFQGSEVPRVYMYVDSGAAPFVLNRLAYPPALAEVKIGTDGSPATGNLRLAWLPGTKCTAEQFGACVATGLDARTNGSLNCGGQRRFVIRQGGLDYDLLNYLDRQILPICSS